MNESGVSEGVCGLYCQGKAKLSSLWQHDLTLTSRQYYSFSCTFTYTFTFAYALAFAYAFTSAFTLTLTFTLTFSSASTLALNVT